MLDPARLVFIDETSTNAAMVRLRGRCPRGIRLIDHVPHGNWKTITFIAGPRRRTMVAPFVLDRPMNATSFIAYLERCLAPTLKRRGMVMMESLPVHKVAGVREVIEAASATLRYLPNILRTSIRSSRLSANSRRIYEKQPTEPFRVSRTGSAPSWPHSDRKNALILPICRLRFHMTGIRSKLSQTGVEWVACIPGQTPHNEPNRS
jgi:hypothetical protein